jgi:hypothetical protein
MLQLSELEERLSYLVGLQKLIGRMKVDHAPRGLGKTSLLQQSWRQYGRQPRSQHVVNSRSDSRDLDPVDELCRNSAKNAAPVLFYTYHS